MSDKKKNPMQGAFNPNEIGPVQIADSITKLGPQFRGTVLVAGSHGGSYCGYLAALAGLRGVIFNDAGIGLDNAGIGALNYLQQLGMAAATVAHTSARIGDGADMLTRGRISYCNGTARTLGCVEGQPCCEAAEIMQQVVKRLKAMHLTYLETRKLLRDAPVKVIACDSASLVKPDDADAVIITGSHGGRLAGRPGYGLAVQARGAVFNDAGVGIDMAGIQRLEILDRNSTPAVTVDAMTARIGDASSAWESGIISHINKQAAKRGVTVGMTVPTFVELLIS